MMETSIMDHISEVSVSFKPAACKSARKLVIKKVLFAHYIPNSPLWPSRVILRTFHSDFVSVEYSSLTSTYVYKWKVETASSLIDYTLEIAGIKMASLLKAFSEQQKIAVLKLKKLVGEPLSSGNAELALMT